MMRHIEAINFSRKLKNEIYVLMSDKEPRKKINTNNEGPHSLK
jgi:hypothetical protein